ncbi:hypothetical protein Hanom_Chr00s097895g01802171 [Helianthus anomalus]
MSWRRRFISSKSSFNSRSEDDSTGYFLDRLSFLLPGGRANSSTSSSTSTTTFRSTLRASKVGVSGSTEDDVFDRLALRPLLDVMVGTPAHFGLFLSRSQHL